MTARPVRAWLCLGSNRGRPLRRLRRALRELDRLAATRVLRASRALRSSPVGRTRQPDFLNCCALVSTRLTPLSLLTECKRLEALAGRRPGPRWGPRPLDIDIVLYDGVRIRTPLLTIPHPEALGRRFVLEGLAEVSPGLRWPGSGSTVEGLRKRLKAPSQNVTVVGPSTR